jgi:hypothetical protein
MAVMAVMVEVMEETEELKMRLMYHSETQPKTEHKEKPT